MIRVRHIVFLVVFLAVVAAHAYDVPSYATERFGNRPLRAAEGVWLWDSGALVTIEADEQGVLTLTLVDTPDPLIDTPCVIGTGRFAGQPGTYNIELVTEGDVMKKNNLGKKARFIGKFINNSRLSLSPYSTGLKINAWRMIPYLLRISVTQQKAPDAIDGAIRVWPNLGSPEFPVIL